MNYAGWIWMHTILDLFLFLFSLQTHWVQLLYGFWSRLSKGQGLVRAYLIPALIESVTSRCLCSCEECKTEGGREGVARIRDLWPVSLGQANMVGIVWTPEYSGLSGQCWSVKPLKCNDLNSTMSLTHTHTHASQISYSNPMISESSKIDTLEGYGKKWKLQHTFC